MKFDMPLLAFLVCASLSATAGHATAQDEAPSYSIDDVKACSKDAIRLCKSKIASIAAIEACMRAHFDELRPACQARFKR